MMNAGTGVRSLLHVGRGIVVANDGDTTIEVLWDENCKQRMCVYDVRVLNYKVIRHG